MKPSEALEAAANILLRDGWYQGCFYKSDAELLTSSECVDSNRTAPCCQAGAISRAIWGVAFPSHVALGREATVEEFQLERQCEDYMAGYLERTVGLHRPSPVAWNDTAGRTRDEVVEALRGAAQDAREAGE